MAQLAEHPTVKRFYKQASSPSEQTQACILDHAWLCRLALDCGADNAGLVEIMRPGLDPQREETGAWPTHVTFLLNFFDQLSGRVPTGGK